MKKPWVTYANGRYVLRWIDPLSLRSREQALGKEISDKEIERAKIRKEQELESRVASVPARLRWSKLLEEVERTYFPRLAPGTIRSYRSTFNVLAKHVKVILAVDLTAVRIDHFANCLRAEKLSNATIRSHLVQLKTILTWAKRRSLIAEVPEIDLPKIGSEQTVSKGRPLSDAELGLILAAIPDAVQVEEHRPSWEFFLRGLWLSGLRLGEAIRLSWDDRMEANVYNRDGRLWLHFPPESQKSRREDRIPATPDFAKLLETVPVDLRTGRVFKLGGFEAKRVFVEDVSKVVSRIGKKAGINVKRYANGKTKYASAHDFRRSFGERWAKVLMPAILHWLMRHREMSTTMKYYATGEAASRADTVWNAYENLDLGCKEGGIAIGFNR